MNISLNIETPQLKVDLELGRDVVHALVAAIDWSGRIHGADDYRGKLATAISEAVLKTLPWELQPPTGPQLAFAASISRRLGVEVPKDATLFRGAMHDFLAAHASQLDGDGYVPSRRKVSAPTQPPTRPQSAIERARELYRKRNP